MSRHLGVSRRGRDFTDAALACVRTAHDNGAKVILHGGDILNARRPDSSDVAALEEVDSELKARGIAMLAIEGNHDKADPPWPSIVGRTAEDGEDLSAATGLVDITGKDVVFRGLSIRGAGCLPAPWLAENIAASRRDGDLPDIILWHGMCVELIGN